MENVNNDGSEFTDKLTQQAKLQDNIVHLTKQQMLGKEYSRTLQE